MHQKKWTMMTICLTYIAAERVQLRVNIICQGDNQSIIIVYQENQKHDKEILRTEFQRQLENVNLFIKTKETWMSKRLFEYGRVRYFNGKSISQATKKLSNLVSDNNDGVNSISSGLNLLRKWTSNRLPVFL